MHSTRKTSFLKSPLVNVRDRGFLDVSIRVEAQSRAWHVPWVIQRAEAGPQAVIKVQRSFGDAQRPPRDACPTALVLERA